MKRAPFLCLLAGGCAIAFAPIFVRLAAPHNGPVASAFWRCALAAPLLWIWALRVAPAQAGIRSHADEAGQGAVRPWGKQWGALILAGLFFAGDLGVWHFSILYTSVATSTVLANLAPIFVTVFGWLIWKTRVTGVFLVGMVTAIAGMFVLVGPEFRQGGQPLLGDALGALTGAFYGGYMLAVKVLRDRDASTARVMAWSTTITALVLLPVALAFPQPFMPQSFTGWMILLGLAIITQIVGQGLIAYAFAHLPASISSVSLLIQPVMAALYAWVLFHEGVGPAQFIGGAIVLAGIWLAKRGS